MSKIDRAKLSADEQRMFDAKNGPVNADTLRSFVRRASSMKMLSAGEQQLMRPINKRLGCPGRARICPR